MLAKTELSPDILQPIALEEWPVLQELLKVDWPKYAFYYQWIENSIKWKKQDPDLAIQIYCPHGKYQEDATFVGISNNNPITALIQYEDRAFQTTVLRTMLAETGFGPDILRPIPVEEWPVLQELLKVDWPIYAFYYYWIENSIRWKKQDPELAIQIYCPHGKYQEDAAFVGISHFSWWSVIVFTKEPSGKRLHEALVKTSRIDWSRGITFSAVHAYIQPILFSALTTLQTDQGIEIDKDVPGCFRIKSADECANVEIEVPEECYLGDLGSSHVPIIHSLWPHADKEQPEKSMKLLQTTVTLNKSMGLFSKEGNVLVSWALHNDWYGLGAVQTLEAYKRRGYAKVVVNALAKRLGKEGISPVLSIVCGNAPSENMFESLNWKRTVPATWVIMKKHTPTAK